MNSNYKQNKPKPKAVAVKVQRRKMEMEVKSTFITTDMMMIRETIKWSLGTILVTDMR